MDCGTGSHAVGQVSAACWGMINCPERTVSQGMFGGGTENDIPRSYHSSTETTTRGKAGGADGIRTENDIPRSYHSSTETTTRGKAGETDGIRTENDIPRSYHSSTETTSRGKAGETDGIRTENDIPRSYHSSTETTTRGKAGETDGIRTENDIPRSYHSSTETTTRGKAGETDGIRTENDIPRSYHSSTETTTRGKAGETDGIRTENDIPRSYHSSTETTTRGKAGGADGIKIENDIPRSYHSSTETTTRGRKLTSQFRGDLYQRQEASWSRCLRSPWELALDILTWHGSKTEMKGEKCGPRTGIQPEKLGEIGRGCRERVQGEGAGRDWERVQGEGAGRKRNRKTEEIWNVTSLGDHDPTGLSHRISWNIFGTHWFTHPLPNSPSMPCYQSRLEPEAGHDLTSAIYHQKPLVNDSPCPVQTEADRK
ncbi:hypothetical protein RRG08_013384 [Elysia crispata]|uniref:Uncharacterized protein n=1 Tax=Elysia crispata TaxID=231223 RepID=A0AAE1B6N9_9GAST|nr:hypothetical protein RRG08_013384 [Elysia crispata]